MISVRPFRVTEPFQQPESTFPGLQTQKQSNADQSMKHAANLSWTRGCGGPGGRPGNSHSASPSGGGLRLLALVSAAPPGVPGLLLRKVLTGPGAEGQEGADNADSPARTGVLDELGERTSVLTGCCGSGFGAPDSQQSLPEPSHSPFWRLPTV